LFGTLFADSPSVHHSTFEIDYQVEKSLCSYANLQLLKMAIAGVSITAMVIFAINCLHENDGYDFFDWFLLIFPAMVLIMGVSLSKYTAALVDFDGFQGINKNELYFENVLINLRAKINHDHGNQVTTRYLVRMYVAAIECVQKRLLSNKDIAYSALVTVVEFGLVFLAYKLMLGEMPVRIETGYCFLIFPAIALIEWLSVPKSITLLYLISKMTDGDLVKAPKKINRRLKIEFKESDAEMY